MTDSKFPAIPAHHKQWFSQLTAAFKNEDVALMSCLDAKTKEPLTVICMVSRDEETGTVEFIPVANFATGDNPFHAYIPPTSDSNE